MSGGARRRAGGAREAGGTRTTRVSPELITRPKPAAMARISAARDPNHISRLSRINTQDAHAPVPNLRAGHKSHHGGSDETRRTDKRMKARGKTHILSLICWCGRTPSTPSTAIGTANKKRNSTRMVYRTGVHQAMSSTKTTTTTTRANTHVVLVELRQPDDRGHLDALVSLRRPGKRGERKD